MADPWRRSEPRTKGDLSPYSERYSESFARPGQEELPSHHTKGLDEFNLDHRDDAGSSSKGVLQKVGKRFLRNVEDEKPRSSRSDFKETLRQLADENEKKSRELALCQNELQLKTRELEQTRASVQSIQTALDTNEHFLGPQASDDEIRSKFETLLRSVKTWSTNFTGEPLNPKNLREGDFNVCRYVLPMCKNPKHVEEATKSKKSRRFFVRGLASFHVCNLVFYDILDGKPQQWKQPELWIDDGGAEYFIELQKRISYGHHDKHAISERSLNDWRAFTTELLLKSVGQGKLGTKQSTKLQAAVKSVMKIVGAWCPADSIAKAHDDLFNIFVDFVHFSGYLCRQRASWTVKFPHVTENPKIQDRPVLLFDPLEHTDDLIDGEDDVTQPRVEIVVTPSLYKQGNSDGNRFDVRSPVVKAQVATYRQGTD